MVLVRVYLDGGIDSETDTETLRALHPTYNTAQLLRGRNFSSAFPAVIGFFWDYFGHTKKHDRYTDTQMRPTYQGGRC